MFLSRVTLSHCTHFHHTHERSPLFLSPSPTMPRFASSCSARSLFFLRPAVYPPSSLATLCLDLPAPRTSCRKRSGVSVPLPAPRILLFLNNVVDERPDAVRDVDAELVAVLEQSARLCGPPDACGCSVPTGVNVRLLSRHGEGAPGQDDSAGRERRALREERDNLGNREDEVAAAPLIVSTSHP